MDESEKTNLNTTNVTIMTPVRMGSTDRALWDALLAPPTDIYLFGNSGKTLSC